MVPYFGCKANRVLRRKTRRLSGLGLSLWWSIGVEPTDLCGNLDAVPGKSWERENGQEAFIDTSSKYLFIISSLIIIFFGSVLVHRECFGLGCFLRCYFWFR